MKKRFSAMLCLLLTGILAVSPLHAEVLSVNGTPKDIPTLIHNDRKLIPLRTISTELGLQVAYDNATKRITVEDGTTTMTLEIGKQTYSINDTTYTMDTTPLIKDGTTYIPIRYIANNFCETLVYNNGYLSVSRNKIEPITIKPYTFRGDTYEFALEAMYTLSDEPIEIIDTDREVLRKAMNDFSQLINELNERNSEPMDIITRNDKDVLISGKDLQKLLAFLAEFDNLKLETDVADGLLKSIQEIGYSLAQCYVAYIENDKDNYTNSLLQTMVLLSNLDYFLEEWTDLSLGF